MTDREDTDRLYGEKEIRELLRRATALQEAAGRQDPAATGLSLAELEVIAADLGIAPELLRAAAADLERGTSPADSFAILKLPRSARIERTVPGKMPEDAWPSVVQEIRRTFGATGQTSQVGSTYEWTSRMDLASVTVTPASDDTRIQVSFRYGPIITGTLFLTGLYSIMGLGATMETLDWAPLAEWAVAGGGFAGIMALTRQVLSTLFSRHRKKLHRLTDRMDATVRGTSERRGQPALMDQAEAAPALEIPASEASSDEPDRSGRRSPATRAD